MESGIILIFKHINFLKVRKTMRLVPLYLCLLVTACSPNGDDSAVLEDIDLSEITTDDESSGSDTVTSEPVGVSYVKKTNHIFFHYNFRCFGAIFYTNYFKTQKISQSWEDKYSDFQISPDKKYVATTEKSSDLSKQVLILLNNDDSGTVIKTFLLSNLNISNSEAAIWILNWSEQNKLWIKAQVGRQIVSLVSFEEPNFSSQQYDLESKNVTDCDFAFNAEREVFVFSNFCPSDTLDLEDAVKNKTKTTLYLYDLKTQNKSIVTEATVKEFSPIWVDDQTIEYNDPSNDSREKQSIN